MVSCDKSMLYLIQHMKWQYIILKNKCFNVLLFIYNWHVFCFYFRYDTGHVCLVYHGRYIADWYVIYSLHCAEHIWQQYKIIIKLKALNNKAC